MPVLHQARTWAARLFGALLIAAAAYVLWRELRTIDPADLAGRMRAWGLWRIGACALLAGASFALITVVEWMGLRWSGSRLPWRTIALRSFVTNALIHSLGANVVTATLTRSWVYRRTGLRVGSSAATTAFAAMTLWCGLASLSGVALLVATPAELEFIRLGASQARAVGGALLAVVAAYVAACVAWPSAKLVGDIRLPAASYALAQVGLGIVDNLISITLFWILITPSAPPYPAFLIAYVLAYLAGLLSGSPGGAGVFEAALFLLAPEAPRLSLAAAFVGFRLIFYLAPLAIGLGLVVLDLLRSPRPVAERAIGR